MLLIHSFTLQKNKNLSNTFQIHVIATDNGYPPKNSINPANVQVFVTRNRLEPRFTRTSYVAQVKETEGVGNKVLDMQARDNDPSVSIQNLLQHTVYFDQLRPHSQ